VERLTANLVDNAARYNLSAGTLRVSTATRAGRAVLSVENSGPVVPPAELEGCSSPSSGWPRTAPGMATAWGWACRSCRRSPPPTAPKSRPSADPRAGSGSRSPSRRLRTAPTPRREASVAHRGATRPRLFLSARPGVPALSHCPLLKATLGLDRRAFLISKVSETIRAFRSPRHYQSCRGGSGRCGSPLSGSPTDLRHFGADFTIANRLQPTDWQAPSR
jgi:hypothetical protein